MLKVNVSEVMFINQVCLINTINYFSPSLLSIYLINVLLTTVEFVAVSVKMPYLDAREVFFVTGSIPLLDGLAAPAVIDRLDAHGSSAEPLRRERPVMALGGRMPRS